jgi:aspartyl-tRNA(Asn)/glutamyl-tRNA(Gln) amidotransferase subunit C
MLSREEVARIARLARIEVAEAELGGLAGQLNGILGLIDEMRAVDTAGVEPMSHPQPVVQRLRADVVTEADQREAFQAVAPAVQDGLYLVPKVIE